MNNRFNIDGEIYYNIDDRQLELIKIMSDIIEKELPKVTYSRMVQSQMEVESRLLERLSKSRKYNEQQRMKLQSMRDCYWELIQEKYLWLKTLEKDFYKDD